MVQGIHKIFAVIDPTSDRQRALECACLLARAQSAVVHAYLCCYSNVATDDYAALQRVELARHRAWLGSLVAEHAQSGLAIECEVEWHEDWRERLAPAAARVGAGLIVKSSFRRTPVRRRLLKTSDWRLLRQAQCPVLLVKRDEILPYGCVLAALASAELDTPEDPQVLALARDLGGAAAALHAVTTCDAAQRHAAAAALARQAALSPEAVHALVARPDDAVTDCAELLDADLVVMAACRSRGLERRFSAERALDRLDTDLLVVTSHQ